MAARKYGAWDKVKSWFRGMQQKVYRGKLERSLEAVGNAGADLARRHIRLQDLAWAPLSPITVKKKGFPTIYVHTREYYNKIKSEVQGTPGEDVLRVVVAIQGKHSSGIDMQHLAVMLEYGTSQMPARPLWRPTFRQLKDTPELAALMKLGPIFGFEEIS